MEPRVRFTIIALWVFGIGCVVVPFFLPKPAFAQDCLTIAQDKQKVEDKGILRYLGVRQMPFTDDPGVFYATPDGVTIFSPVVGGCVMPQAFPVGRLKEETGA